MARRRAEDMKEKCPACGNLEYRFVFADGMVGHLYQTVVRKSGPAGKYDTVEFRRVRCKRGPGPGSGSGSESEAPAPGKKRRAA